MMFPDTILQRLRQAQRIVFFTGAGVSAESGISTFRDHADGLWGKFDPMEVATPFAFAANPQKVWDWYSQRADVVRKAVPNAGHRAIAQLSPIKNVEVITQNVDNLHQAAGSPSVLELHGNLFRLKPFFDKEELSEGGRTPIICPACGGLAASDMVDAFGCKDDLQGIELVAGPVPRCPCCNTLMRPGVVWFYETLDNSVLDAAEASVIECDVLICVGSSLEVQPAASLPFLAKQNGSLIVEVNPQPTSLSEIADATLVGSAAEVLPLLMREVWGVTEGGMP